MITINKNIQSEILMTTMEELVPEDSIFRKIDKYIDFTFIYDEVKDLYCKDNGRPSIDPVVLFKIVFIQALDGIKSMRQTCKKIKVDAEYRWFLGIPFGQDTPHFSTFGKNYERRFKDTDIFEKIFINIVKQAIKYKLVDGEIFYTDSTHKKANANKNKYDDCIVHNTKQRRKWLEEEITKERPQEVFTSIYHLINKELLKECFDELDGNKAVGIDKITKDEYRYNLDTNLNNLVERLKNKSYKPSPARKVEIPKANGKVRSLAIANFEDKIVQLALKKIIGAIYEPKFPSNMFGFRPNKS